MSSTLEQAIAELETSLTGRLILPGDAEYDQAREVMHPWHLKRPGVIVRVADTADVQRTVAAARTHGLELAVRSGGHSGAGHSTTQGGLVMDLRDMSRIEVDARARTATVQTGATTGEVSKATTDQGLVVGFGDTATVGVGGITLGGGVGYLVRKWGLAIDSLLSAEVVIADGRILTANDTEHPDLFWALRGGGGNFGVVTTMTFRLQELPEFTGGLLCLPATAATIAGFIAAAQAAPEELSTIANVMPAPPMPFLPEEVHGLPVVLAMLAHAGDEASAQAALAPFRALATPYVDLVAPGPYLQMFPPEEEADVRPMAVARTFYLDHVGLPEAQQILDMLATSGAAFCAAQLRVLGGAAARVPVEATAYAHRKSAIMAVVAAFHTAEDRAERLAWVEKCARSLQQADQGAYVGLLTDEAPERVHAAYPGDTWHRLAQVKEQYDPTNLFRLNQNIPPGE